MEETENYSEQATEKMKQIVAAIKRKTAMTVYKVNILEDGNPTIFSSKFGGVPYWDFAKTYPVSVTGRKMMLLAQINFSKAALEDERLPKQGMLQFFIDSEDDLYGMDFDEPAEQKKFRIVYHEAIDETVTQEQIMALEIPVATDETTEYTPVFREVEVELCKTETYMGPGVYTFANIFCETVKEQTGEDVSEDDMFEYIEENGSEYLYDELDNSGHWILGYPYFTQEDPRGYREDGSNYNTLLFQMDSEMRQRRDYVLWGDCGVANFFMDEAALKEKKFDKVMYNWDCG